MHLNLFWNFLSRVLLYSEFFYSVIHVLPIFIKILVTHISIYIILCISGLLKSSSSSLEACSHMKQMFWRIIQCISCVLVFPWLTFNGTFYDFFIFVFHVQAFKETHHGKKPPGVLKTLFEVISQVKSSNRLQSSCNISILWYLSS